VSCQLYALATLPTRKELTLPIEQVASWAGRIGEKVNLLSFPEIEPRLLSCLARTLVAIPTELGGYALLFKHPVIRDVSGSVDISLLLLKRLI